MQEPIVGLRKLSMVCSLILCLLAVSSLTGIRMSVNADPKVWTVDDTGSGDFYNIQDAINNASSGDAIFVYTGFYYEHLVVNKSLCIEGEDPEHTVIDGGRTGTVVDILSNDVSFSGFTVRRSGINYGDGGIRGDQVSNATIFHNNVTENSNGVSLRFSSNSVIEDNYISSNNNEGVFLRSSHGNVVSGNVIQGNVDGIVVYLSNYNVLCDNIVKGNSLSGVQIISSSNNSLHGNTVNASGIYGVYLSYTSNNIFCHNNFNNSVQIWWINSTNIWDYGAEGNYWSDYSGRDANSDGIGDYAYATEESTWDSFPLMGIYTSFGMTAEGRAYDVAFVSNSTVSNLTFTIGMETGNKILLLDIHGQNGSIGFCRVTLPSDVMTYPYVILLDGDMITPSSIKMSDGNATLYFTYPGGSYTARIISSEAMRLYEQLLEDYAELQASFSSLNVTYYGLLGDYVAVLGNYTQLQARFEALNQSYQQLYELNTTYYELLDGYARLQNEFSDLNLTHLILADSYVALQASFASLNSTYQQLAVNYAQLQTINDLLNASYQAHLADASERTLNLQKITYAVSAMVGVLLIAIVYLSKQAHSGVAKRQNVEG